MKKKDLLTILTYDILPFIVTADISLIEGLMLVDIKQCRNIKNKYNPNELEEILSLFNQLNLILAKFFPEADKKEAALFEYSTLELIKNKPHLLVEMEGSYVDKRIAFYKKYKPEVIKTLDSILEETNNISRKKAA